MPALNSFDFRRGMESDFHSFDFRVLAMKTICPT
jgi:hypothetical protein